MTRGVHTAGLLLGWFILSGQAAPTTLPAEPPGPFFDLSAADHDGGAASFASGEPVVCTSYFYWYDVYSGAHFRNADGTDAMTVHPRESGAIPLSYKLPEWHEHELRQMANAGIDVVLPVFWGIPGDYDDWSFTGLQALVEAHDRLLAAPQENSSVEEDGAGRRPPMIGMFYDTSTLLYNRFHRRREEKIDLTTPAGRDWFYTTIRDFWSMVPPSKWARIDGKPLIFLYSANFATAIDAELYAEARRRFQADFGTDFFLVRHADWPPPADAWYQWGGALGIRFGRHTAAFGPGYDHSAVPNRKPLVVDREDGRFYDRQWEHLLRLPVQRRPWLVHLETWNEWHEGTGIAPSVEYGFTALRSTEKYAALFHAGERLPRSGPFVDARRVRWSASEIGGLTLRVPAGDGYWKRDRVADVDCVTTVGSPEGAPGRFLYFDVDDSYLYGEIDTAVEITIMFYDRGCDRFVVQYDNTDASAGALEGAFRPAPPIALHGTSTWRTASLQLPDAYFANRANGGDFRLAVLGGEGRLSVREVIVRRLPGRVMPVTTTGPRP